MWASIINGIMKQAASRQLFGSQLRKNMSSGVIVAVANVLVLFISYPIYLHYLGYERYGIWLILATVLSFAQMGNLGITQAITKLVAEEYGHNNLKGVESYISTSLLVLSVSGIIVLMVVLFLKNQIVGFFRLSVENELVALRLIPYIGLLSVYVFLVQSLNAVVMGLGRMDHANYIQIAGRGFAVIVAVVMLSAGRGIESLLISNVLSYVIIHIGSLCVIKKTVKVNFLKISNLNSSYFKKLFQFGGGVLGSSLLGLLIEPFNKLMLSRYAGAASIPVFEIAFKGAVQLRSLLDSGIRAIMPEISLLKGVGTNYAKERIKSVIHKANKIVILGGLPAYLALFIAVEILLKLWLGDKYVVAIPLALRIILIGSYVNLLSIPAHYTIMGFGKVRYILRASIIAAATNIISVITIKLLMQHVSVNSICICVATAFVFGSVYLIHKGRCLLACNC